MSIELTEEQTQGAASLRYDDAPWTPQEIAILAGLAFNKLDGTDYSEYLHDKP